MRTIILFGAPGSGKGTQSALIAQKSGFAHLSTGDILRAEVTSKSELGILAESYMSKGSLVPDELIINILAKKIDDKNSPNGIILDGFPRTIEQAKALNEMLQERNAKVDALIDIEVEEQALFDRLVLRGATSGRADDTPETIKKRFNVYKEQTAPVKEFYRDSNCYFSVSNNGTVEESFANINKILLGRGIEF